MAVTNTSFQTLFKATEDEIAEYMEALGFEMDYIDEFHNEHTKSLTLSLTMYYMVLMVTYISLIRK